MNRYAPIGGVATSDENSPVGVSASSREAVDEDPTLGALCRGGGA
jgi:hypothetical protein